MPDAHETDIPSFIEVGHSNQSIWWWPLGERLLDGTNAIFGGCNLVICGQVIIWSGQQADMKCATYYWGGRQISIQQKPCSVIEAGLPVQGAPETNRSTLAPQSFGLAFLEQSCLLHLLKTALWVTDQSASDRPDQSASETGLWAFAQTSPGDRPVHPEKGWPFLRPCVDHSKG